MNRSNITSLIPLVAGAVLAYLILHFSSIQPSTNFEDAALGEQSARVVLDYEDYPIHITSPSELPKLVEGWEIRGKNRSVLWLGNSQLHAINQPEANAQPASLRTFVPLQEQGVDVLTFSLPNANPQEHLLLFEDFRRQLPVELLVLPVVFDDFRESSIRESLLPLFGVDSLQNQLIKTKAGRRLSLINAPTANQGDASQTEAGTTSLQDKTEKVLDEWCSKQSVIYAARPQLRGKLFLGAYLLRNRIFGITSQTVRHKIPGRYAINLDAIDAILDVAKSSDVHVLCYVVPLRQDIPTPYDQAEYQDFKLDIERLTLERNATFIDLDLLIEGKHWGEMPDVQGGGAGYDFMHFKEGGHILLADEIGKMIRQRMGSN